MTTATALYDPLAEDDQVGRIDVLAYVLREAFAHRYSGVEGYARMYDLIGIPYTRPAFEPGRKYHGSAADVLAAAVHNARSVTRRFTGRPDRLPLITMSAEKYREITDEEARHG